MTFEVQKSLTVIQQIVLIIFFTLCN